MYGEVNRVSFTACNSGAQEPKLETLPCRKHYLPWHNLAYPDQTLVAQCAPLSSNCLGSVLLLNCLLV